MDDSLGFVLKILHPFGVFYFSLATLHYTHARTLARTAPTSALDYELVYAGGQRLRFHSRLSEVISCPQSNPPRVKL